MKLLEPMSRYCHYRCRHHRSNKRQAAAARKRGHDQEEMGRPVASRLRRSTRPQQKRLCCPSKRNLTTRYKTRNNGILEKKQRMTAAIRKNEYQLAKQLQKLQKARATLTMPVMTRSLSLLLRHGLQAFQQCRSRWRAAGGCCR